MKKIALAIFLMANCLAAFAQQAVILFGPINSQEEWVKFEAKLREFKLVTADNQVDMARVLPALHLDMAENNPAALQALPKDMHEPAGFVANMGRFGLQPKMTLAAVKDGILNQQFKFVVAGAETKPAPVASTPAAPAAVAAASAPKKVVEPPVATPPAVDQTQMMKKLAERFDKRLGDQQMAQERAETLRREAEQKLSAKLRVLEGKLKNAPNQAVIDALKAEIAETNMKNSQAEAARKQALGEAVSEAKAARDEVTESFFYRNGGWVWAMLALILVAVIGAYAYVHRQGRALRKAMISEVNREVTNAAAPIDLKAQNAATLAQGADGVVNAFAAQVTKNEEDIARTNAALKGLGAQLADTTKRLEVVEDVLGVDPKWSLDRQVRQAIFDTCFDLEENQEAVLPIRLTAEVTRHLKVTRGPGETVFVEGLSQQDPRNPVNITELGRIITRAYHQKTFRGVEPQMALAA